jgi:TrmH family RNA methyltransferase
MLSKNKAKFIRSLQLRKYRQKYHKFTVEGVKIVNDLIREKLARVDLICATDTWISRYGSHIPEDIEVIPVSPKELGKVSSFKTPNEVLAVADMREGTIPVETAQEEICLYLDAIRDPGNMGTILRTADWFGVRNVFVSPDCVDIYNPKVIQSSMASIFRVNVTTLESDVLIAHSALGIYASSLEGKPLPDVIPPKSGFIVMGNESQGTSESLQNHATERIRIPGDKKLGAESLNVAVATGIILAWAG